MAPHLEQTKSIKLVYISYCDADRFLVPNRRRILDIAKSMREIGQIHEISVYPITQNSYRLITGAARFYAAKELGWLEIRASIWIGNAAEFKLMELHEAEAHRLSPAKRKQLRIEMQKHRADHKALLAQRGKISVPLLPEEVEPTAAVSRISWHNGFTVRFSKPIRDLIENDIKQQNVTRTELIRDIVDRFYESRTRNEGKQAARQGPARKAGEAGRD